MLACCVYCGDSQTRGLKSEGRLWSQDCSLCTLLCKSGVGCRALFRPGFPSGTPMGSVHAPQMQIAHKYALFRLTRRVKLLKGSWSSPTFSPSANGGSRRKPFPDTRGAPHLTSLWAFLSQRPPLLVPHNSTCLPASEVPLKHQEPLVSKQDRKVVPRAGKVVSTGGPRPSLQQHRPGCHR